MTNYGGMMTTMWFLSDRTHKTNLAYQRPHARETRWAVAGERNISIATYGRWFLVAKDRTRPTTQRSCSNGDPAAPKPEPGQARTQP